MIFFLWIVLSLIVGAYGGQRNIGFGGALILSLILSPLVGFIIAAVSQRKTELPPQPGMQNQSTVLPPTEPVAWHK